MTKIKTVSKTTSPKLGRELIIKKNTEVFKAGPGYKHEYFVPSIQVTIGIGNDHTADLSMTDEAWAAFKNGEKIIL